MLSDPVAEAFGLIHLHPSGENFCRVDVPTNWLEQIQLTQGDEENRTR